MEIRPLWVRDRAVRGPSSDVLGGSVDGCPAATAMVGRDGHRGRVYYRAVESGRRRMGHGRTMTLAAEAWVRAAGVPKIQLMVRSSNAAALGFYDALGLAAEDTSVRSRWLGPR